MTDFRTRLARWGEGMERTGKRTSRAGASMQGAGCSALLGCLGFVMVVVIVIVAIAALK